MRILALLLCLLAAIAPAEAWSPAWMSGAAAAPSANPVFTALHTYYMAPASGGGSDSNSGTSAGSPWLTPNHSVVCGDVIIAAAGAYSSDSLDSYGHGSSRWGAVSSCPSTSAGIDGTGGVYVANIVCATAFGCTINATTQFSVDIDKSNWAMTGWYANNTNNGNGSCFAAVPNNTTSIAYVAFINSIAVNCPLGGIYSGSYPGTVHPAVDEFASVGNIAFNAAQSSSFCGSGLGVNTPVNVDALAGTHVFFSGNFSYGNIDGACSPNSNFVGAFTTASGNYLAGASSIGVAAVSGWGVGWPILGLAGAGAYASGVVSPTLVSSVTGTTIGLSANVAAPGVTSGQVVAVGTTTDGEGLIFDTWSANPYTGQAAVENNIFWGNGSAGFEMFCAGTCSTARKVYVTQNTLYGNIHDYKRDGNGWDFFLNDTTGIGTFSATNNLVQSDVLKPLGSTTFAAWNGTTGVGQAGTGQPVVSAAFGRTGLTVSGNYFASAASATCPVFATCDGGNNIAQYNGASYASGNTLSAPGFASPGTLPTGAPSCSGYATTTDCMNTGYGVYSKLVPSVAPTSKGYQAPGACAADSLYPTWLKGAVYLQWSGTALTENTGLVNKPCGV